MRAATATVILVVVLVGTAPVPVDASASDMSIDVVYDAYPTPDPACRGFRVHGDGVARGAPVGVATWRDDECASFVTEPGRVTVRGCLRMANESGVLVASYQASSPLPDLGGFLYFSGSFTITAGQGRFASATGGGEITATANVNRPAARAHLEGSYAPAAAGNGVVLPTCVAP